MATSKPEVDEDPSIFIKTFEIKKLLGSGSFGVVYQVLKKEFGDPLDVFKISFSTDSSEESFEIEENFAIKIIPEGRVAEASFLAELCHPNIMSCYNVWAEDGRGNAFKSLPEIKELLRKNVNLKGSSVEDEVPTTTSYVIPPYLLMQLEFCTEGTLDKLLEKKMKTPFSLNDGPYKYYPETQNLFSQILEALVFMEMKNIVHGDLKPDNIFLTRRSNGAILAKIGDFGLTSPVMAFCATNEPKLPSGAPPTEQDLQNQILGRPINYKSPEQAKLSLLKKNVVGATGASHKSDMYSLGLIFIQMLIPFQSDEGRRGAIYDAMQPQRNSPPYRQYLTDHFKDNELIWVDRMLNFDIEKRPSASELQSLTLAVPGYEIHHGSKIPREKLEDTFSLFNGLIERDLDDIDETLRVVKRRLYYHLIELIHEGLISLPPDDDILIETLKHLKSFKEAPESASVNLLYLLRKFIPLLENVKGVDDLLTLKWLFLLATSEATTTDYWEEGMRNLSRLQATTTFVELDRLHPFKMEVELFVLMIGCQANEFTDEPTEGGKEGLTFKAEELENALKKAERMYRDMTNDLGLDPLKDQLPCCMLLVRIKLMTQLGQTEEAERIFHDIVDSIPTYGDELPQSKSILITYCKFLVYRHRNEEAIEIMQGICKKCEDSGDELGRKEALLHLLGCYLNPDGTPFDGNDEGWKSTMVRLYRNWDLQMAKTLLVDPSQLQKEEVDFRTREVQFHRFN